MINVMELRGTYKGGGGPDKTILLSAKNHSNRFFVLVAYLRSPGDSKFQIGRKAKELGIDHYVEVIDKRMIDFSCLFQLSSLIREYHIQIIHAHDLKSTLLGLLLKILHPSIRIMHTAHGWIINSKTDHMKQKVHSLMLRFYPFHIAVSKATRNILLNNGIQPKKIQLLYNAIDVDFWRRNGKPSTLRKEFGIDDSTLIVGSIGRLSPEKDLPTFFRVAREVLQTCPKTCFIIAGDGKQDEFTYYQNLAKELGIDKSVILTGHRNDLKNLYISFDIFLMTSLTEGLPNVLLEAMAMGMPVVATSVGGVSELVIDEKTGSLCQAGDIKALRRKVVRLLENQEKRKRFSLNARERIVERFCFRGRLGRIEDYYLKILAH